jgi:hypothetical protein
MFESRRHLGLEKGSINDDIRSIHNGILNRKKKKRIEVVLKAAKNLFRNEKTINEEEIHHQLRLKSFEFHSK